MLAKLRELDEKELKRLVKYGLSYPPRVRAFLGALLENLDKKDELEKLKRSLNPLSEYRYNIKEDILPTVLNWNLK